MWQGPSGGRMGPHGAAWGRMGPHGAACGRIGSHWVAIPYAIGTWGPAAGEIGVGFKPPPSRIPRNLGGVIGVYVYFAILREF